MAASVKHAAGRPYSRHDEGGGSACCVEVLPRALPGSLSPIAREDGRERAFAGRGLGEGDQGLSMVNNPSPGRRSLSSAALRADPLAMRPPPSGRVQALSLWEARRVRAPAMS